MSSPTKSFLSKGAQSRVSLSPELSLEASTLLLSRIQKSEETKSCMSATMACLSCSCSPEYWRSLVCLCPGPWGAQDGLLAGSSESDSPPLVSPLVGILSPTSLSESGPSLSESPDSESDRQ